MMMMEAENNPLSSATESRPETNEENEVERIKLKKYGCGIRMVDWVSALGWYGLALSVLSILASIVMVLTPWTFKSVCGSNFNCNIVTVVTAVIWAIFSSLWGIFSVRLLKNNKDWPTEELKDLVKTGCSIIGCIQVICGGYFLTAYTVSLVKILDSPAIPKETLAADIICMLGSLALISFSSLLIYGVLRKKTKPVLAFSIFNLVLECFLIIYFSMDIHSSRTEMKQLFSPIFGIIATLIHLSYSNGLVILHYNILLHNMGFYKKNLEFFNKAFQVQV